MLKYCLFPVAGFGTRFLPVTKTVPKELLPILDKPLIQYAIDEAYESGLTEMVLIINKHKSVIKKYFEFPMRRSTNLEIFRICGLTSHCELQKMNSNERIAN